MKIEIETSPRYKDAPPEDSCHYLKVNGYVIGSYYGGKEKKYENPEKWAKEMKIKRRTVLFRNIERLENELSEFKKELSALSE